MLLHIISYLCMLQPDGQAIVCLSASPPWLNNCSGPLHFVLSMLLVVHHIKICSEHVSTWQVFGTDAFPDFAARLHAECDTHGSRLLQRFMQVQEPLHLNHLDVQAVTLSYP